MQFSYEQSTASVFARGKIDPGTAARLEQFLDVNRIGEGTTVHFHSPGGSLSEGMQLGQIIRKRRLNTNVGAEGATGICASACAIAFLGGVSRSVPPGSKYGVHRFRYANDAKTGPGAYAQVELAQITSAALIHYFTRMGVDPELYATSALTSSNTITLITPDLLKKWRVITEEKPRVTVSWSVEEAAGAIYLRGQRKDGVRTDTLVLSCREGALFLFAYYHGKVGRDLASETLLLDSEPIRLAHQRASLKWDDGVLVAIYRLGNDVWPRLRSARTIGVVAQSEPNGSLGTAEMPFANGAAEREQFASRCMAAAAR
jgi:hypothetical protein